MRKTISVLLIVAMILAIGVSAAADGQIHHHGRRIGNNGRAAP